MTIYIFGGSNTAMSGGWADKLSETLYRRYPVQNLGLGATNSLNALVRLLGEVTLAPGDTVLWANAINDAICLSGRAYPAGRMCDYVEAMIRHCAAAGARFIPVILDTFPQHLQREQAAYGRAIDALCDHYGLRPVHLPRAFAAETGTTQIPRHHYTDILHLVRGGEMVAFVAELATARIDQGGPPPADVPPLFLSPGTRFQLARNFVGVADEEVHTPIYHARAWRPPVTVTPEVPPGTRAWVEGVTLVADPFAGRVALTVGAAQVILSASHNFAYTQSVLALTASIPLLCPQGLALPEGGALRFDWDPSGHPIDVDMYFAPTPRGAAFGGGPGTSRARVVSVLLRRETV